MRLPCLLAVMMSGNCSLSCLVKRYMVPLRLAGLRPGVAVLLSQVVGQTWARMWLSTSFVNACAGSCVMSARAPLRVQARPLPFMPTRPIVEKWFSNAQVALGVRVQSHPAGGTTSRFVCSERAETSARWSSRR